jgi:hypothetical protein
VAPQQLKARGQLHLRQASNKTPDNVADKTVCIAVILLLGKRTKLEKKTPKLPS